MKRFTRFLTKSWPVLVLLSIELVLFITNYTKGTHLVGWDNLFPEFDFGLNFKRTLFATWQEYRGLGYEDGMSHAANLPHYLYIFLLSFVFPSHMLRYVFMFSLHALGGIGMYQLLRFLFKKHSYSKLIPLCGALFYQFNLATIQMFFLPFEVFISHFGFLPWLILFALRYLEDKSRRSLLIFSLLSFLSTGQAHVPTVFIVYAGTLSLVLIFELIRHRKKAVKPILMILLMTFLTNAYWGLPFLWSTRNNAYTIANSKNNQMASEDIFLKNHKYGDLENTALMRGFALETVQYDYKKGVSEFMLLPWKNHIDIPIVKGVSWAFFILSLLGIAITLKKRRTHVYPFVGLFVLTFIIIGNDVVGIEHISYFLRTYVPLFGSVFRFVYTKFFILYAFTSAILSGIALYQLTHLVDKTRLSHFVVLIFLGSLLYQSYPVFKGHFFYDNLRVSIPKEYFEVFDFFKTQPQDERIAILPAPWYWGWTQYRWGSIGSGFQWFGIGQPTLDRAFDPWSDKNENFYWEISQAIYSSDKTRFERVLQKHQVKWILLDGQIVDPGKPAGSLNLSQIEKDINFSDQIQFVKSFGRIRLYKVVSNETATHLSLVKSAKNIGPAYQFNDFDRAAFENPVYLTDKNQEFAEYYPFRSLFTGRSQKELEFDIRETETEIFFSTILPQYLNSYYLFTPPYSEDSLVEVDPSKNWEDRIKWYPKVQIDGQEILDTAEKNASEASMYTFPTFSEGKLEIVVPKVWGYYGYNSDPWDDFEQSTRSCDPFNTGEMNHEIRLENTQKILKLTSRNSSNCVNFHFDYFPQRQSYLVTLETKNIEGKPLKFDAVNGQTGRNFLDTYLEKNYQFSRSYFVVPPMEYSSLGYNFNLDNISFGRERSINELRKVEIHQIPYELLTQLKFVNPNYSSNSEVSTNNSKLVSVSHPNPAEYWVKLGDKNDVIGETSDSSDTSFGKILEGSGSVMEAVKSQSTTLILSQSFHPGWLAYQVNSEECTVKSLCQLFPYLFGKRLTDHVLVNNWANGWTLPVNSEQCAVRSENLNGQLPTAYCQLQTIYLFFWPQLLQFLGFALLPLPFLYVLRRKPML